MDREWTRSPLRAQPASNRLSVQHQRAACAAILRRPFPRRQQGPVRHAHRRHADDRPELERKAGSARMVASGRVYQEHVGSPRQRRDRRLQQRALTQGEQARTVGGHDTAPRKGACDDAPLERHGRCRPAWLPLDTSRPRVAGKAHEAPSDRIRIRWRLPWGRLRQRQLALRASQRLGGRGPGCAPTSRGVAHGRPAPTGHVEKHVAPAKRKGASTVERVAIPVSIALRNGCMDATFL